MDYYQGQIHITKDGFDIQTSVETYTTYYKKIGWEYVKQAPTLPGIVNVELTRGIIEELTVKQMRLI